MADDVTLNSMTGGPVVATDEVTGTGEHVQIVKLAYSGDGDRTTIDADATGLRTFVTGTVASGAAYSVGDNGFPALVKDSSGNWSPLSLDVSGNLKTVVEGYAYVKPEPTSGAFPVSDNGGSLTVDGTVSVSGTVTVGTHAVTYPSSRQNGAIFTSSESLLPVCGLDAGGTWRALLVDTVASGSAALLTKSARKPTPYKLNSAASTNATSVSATANTLLLGYYISNTNSSVRYVKFYNKASAPTVGTDTPVLVLAIPGSGAANVSFPDGVNFTTGLAFATTTGAADSDTGAVALNEVIVNLVYATY